MLFPDHPRILVLGDVMIDRYLSGRVDRISPEAPVPVIRLGAEENRLGGAGNVALNLWALGAETGLAGAIGGDDNALLLRRILTEHAIDGSLLLDDPDRCTTVKTRLMAQGQQLLRADREDTHDLSAAMTERLLAAVGKLLSGTSVDVLLLQDYNKGVLTEALITGAIELAREHGVRVVVDPKATNFWTYQRVDIFKPNLREIQQQVDFPVTPVLADLDRAAAFIFDRLGTRAVMITLSEHGIYVHDGTTSEILPTAARRVADVSGAGDSVIAVAACGLAAGMPLRDIARLANLAGEQVIAKSGVVPVNLAALTQAWEKLTA